MPDDDSNTREWVVEPAGPDEVALFVAVGDGVELTAEQETALGALIESLEKCDPEVAGYINCPSNRCGDVLDCSHLNCGKVNCSLACIKMNKVAVSAAGTSWSLTGTFGTNLA
jgi:hypothetical protein